MGKSNIEKILDVNKLTANNLSKLLDKNLNTKQIDSVLTISKRITKQNQQILSKKFNFSFLVCVESRVDFNFWRIL